MLSGCTTVVIPAPLSKLMVSICQFTPLSGENISILSKEEAVKPNSAIGTIIVYKSGSVASNVAKELTNILFKPTTEPLL